MSPAYGASANHLLSDHKLQWNNTEIKKWTQTAGKLISAAVNREQKDTLHQLIVLAVLCLVNGMWAPTKGDLDYSVSFSFTQGNVAVF